MKTKSSWIQPKDLDINKWFGFVYIIRELDTGMDYIGIKQFWSKQTLKPLKGKKNKRHRLVESDWKTYNTSSPIMQKKLKENPEGYCKVMLYLADSKTDLKATEAYYQLQNYKRGNWNKLYNEVINLRLRIPKGK